jgi:peptidoglycan/LPS O-acetylase OafA/YrhL
VNPRIGWGQPPPGWGQPFPGWAPLVDPGPRSVQVTRTLGRWWWPTLTVAGFLAVVVQVLDHDPSALGLSYRGLVTVALAALVVVLLTIHRRFGPRALARAVAEYATVALLATLLTAPAGTGDHRPADRPPGGQARAQAAAGQDQPAVLRPVIKVLRAGAKLVRGVTGAIRWLVNLWHWADQQATTNGEATATQPPLPCPVCSLKLEVPLLMWSSLPSNLRTVLGTALLLGLGVAAAAFTLSFFALRDAAADPALAWGAGHAWLFPIGVDMALVFFEVLLLGASMVRIHDHGRVVQYPRAIPFLLMLVAAAGTLYFNATHVPEQVRLLALAVPAASILVTLGLAYLLKMLAAASGAAAIHLAPPALEPTRIVRSSDVLQGELVRDPQALGGAPSPYGQVPSWAPSQLDQTGHPAAPGGSDGESKRRQVEAYLAALGPEQLGRLTTLGPRAAARELTGTLNDQGLQVSERYVQQILDDWTAATRPQPNGRRRPR